MPASDADLIVRSINSLYNWRFGASRYLLRENKIFLHSWIIHVVGNWLDQLFNSRARRLIHLPTSQPPWSSWQRRGQLVCYRRQYRLWTIAFGVVNRVNITCFYWTKNVEIVLVHINFSVRLHKFTRQNNTEKMSAFFNHWQVISTKQLFN